MKHLFTVDKRKVLKTLARSGMSMKEAMEQCGQHRTWLNAYVLINDTLGAQAIVTLATGFGVKGSSLLAPGQRQRWRNWVIQNQRESDVLFDLEFR
jgi:hypothetical protein